MVRGPRAGERTAPRSLTGRMTGRRIRWGSLVRLAAVAAAVLAGLAVLPALLGSDEPPPLPEDVGLAEVAPPAPPEAPVTPDPTPPPVGTAPISAKKVDGPAKKLGGPARKPVGKRAHGRRGESGGKGRGNEGPPGGEESQQDTGGRGSKARKEQPAGDAVAPEAIPTYTPSYSRPPSRGEFEIER
jgi:hypothetical protein